MDSQPLIFVHLKLVAKLSLALGALAIVVLAIALTMITDHTGDSYAAIVQFQSLKRQNLGTVMLVAGLILLAITGFATWLITLYSSARIAGPLYRFSQNLKLANAGGNAALIELRKNDALVAQAAAIKQAVASVREHFAAARTAATEASNALAAGDAAAYADAVARLKALDEKIRI